MLRNQYSDETNKLVVLLDALNLSLQSHPEYDFLNVLRCWKTLWAKLKILQKTEDGRKVDNDYIFTQRE